MRRFFRILLLALVLVLVFLVSAMTAMRMAIHGRETAVPKLVGLTPAQAENAAISNGLLVEVENRFYSPDVPEGRIMSQLPTPGTKVRRGWKIRVAQSLGPQRVAIPNLVGQSQRAAEINLAQRGLQLGSTASVHLPNVQPDQIVAQSPPPNAEGVASPKVNLLLTAPVEDNPTYYVMPDFVGHKFGEATSAMAQAGFRVGSVKVTPGNSLSNGAANGQSNGFSSAPANGRSNPKLRPIATDTITHQFPAPGQKIGSGAAINFELTR